MYYNVMKYPSMVYISLFDVQNWIHFTRLLLFGIEFSDNLSKNDLMFMQFKILNH